MRRFLSLLVGFLAALLCVATSYAGARTVVVVMFDGFSPFMMDGIDTPHFDRMAREGAHSRHLVPVFPALSMVNHTSFATGCWPAHHGIVSNTFVDPAMGRYDSGADRADAAWRTGCESMWQAAERQGAPAAVFNFVGRWSSKTGNQATRINDEVPWKDHEDDETILAKATATLADPKFRLIALYFDYPDSVAHGDGVHGEKTKAAVARADAVIGRLMDAAKIQSKHREIAIVVVADHGMTKVDKVINIGTLEKRHGFEADAAYGSGTAMLYLKPGSNPARITKALSRYRNVFRVYQKPHFPAYAHIGSGPRTGDLLLITYPPYAFQGPEIMTPAVAARPENRSGRAIYEPRTKWFHSMHGFDPELASMHAIFYAWGAGVKPGLRLKRIEMIDVAPTVLHLIGLKPGEGSDGEAVVLGNLDEKPDTLQPVTRRHAKMVISY